jgi:O-antigen/teichoic acid export membrane protein
VTPFALAQRLAESVFLLANQFLKVLLPVAAGFDPARDAARLRSLFLTGTRLGLVLALPVALIVGILAPALLTAWVGREYAEHAPLVAILAAAFVVDAVTWPAGSVLVGIGRQRPLAWMAAANGAGNVVLSIALVKPFGLTGVAIGTLVPNVCEGLLLAVPYAMRTIGVTARQLLRTSLLPHLVPSAVVAASLMLARVTVDPAALALAGVALAAAAVYPLLYLALGGATTERDYVLSAIRRTSRRLPPGGSAR